MNSVLLTGKVLHSSHYQSSGIIAYTYVKKIYSAYGDFLLCFAGEKCFSNSFTQLIK